jgi:hypothetical protein
MGKLAFLIVLLILITIPPISRVVDPPACLGMCMFDLPTRDEIITLNIESSS